jgi:hypothetical protein
MRSRLADDIKEFSHKAEAVRSSVEKRVDVNGLLDLASS